MSSTQENRATRDYLVFCRPWIFNLYSNGVKFDEIHEKLCHHRDPWISASKLRSAIDRWKDNDQPDPWLEQPLRTPGFIIPELLLPPELTMRMPNVGHLSLPARPRLAHADPRLHHSEPSRFMRTSMMGIGMSISSSSQPGIYSPYYTSQSVQHQQYQNQNLSMNDSYSHSPHNAASQPMSQVVAPTFHNNLPSETVEEDAENVDDYETQIGTVCTDCYQIRGRDCQCYQFG